MAFLMLLHEKLRLQRKVNKLTLRQLKASSRKERMTKSIERIQKMYSTRHTKLQKMAQFYQSQFNVWAQNASGLGTQGLNPLAFANGGGTSMFAMGMLQKWVEGAAGIKDSKDNQIFKDQATAEALLSAKQNGALRQNTITDENGKDVIDKENPWTDGTNYFTNEQVAALNSGMNQIAQMESFQRANVQQLTQQYQNNVSIWLEAAEAQLDEEQDAMLAPLEEQQTEWDMESQSCEVQLTDARARLENIKQALSEGIKDSAPSFGLG